MLTHTDLYTVAHLTLIKPYFAPLTLIKPYFAPLSYFLHEGLKGALKERKQQPVDDPENWSPLVTTSSTSPIHEVVPGPSSAYEPSPDYPSVHYTSPYLEVGNYNAFSPMPSYYMPHPNSSYLMHTHRLWNA